jgi:hypothetical protein
MIGGGTTIKIEEAPWNVLRDMSKAVTKIKREKKNKIEAPPARRDFGRVSNAQLRAAFSSLDDDEREHRAHIFFFIFLLLFILSFLLFNFVSLIALRLQTAYRDRAALRRAISFTI